MSFKLFNVEFNGEDNFYPNHKLMDKVYGKIGKKFLKEWLQFGVDEEIILDLGDVNQIYKWIRCYETSDYKNLRNVGDMEGKMEEIQNEVEIKKNKKDVK
tara:strand:+ start:108 stop:407 length:300 start_codon:yes stop_codon:yes gene_type:complete